MKKSEVKQKPTVEVAKVIRMLSRMEKAMLKRVREIERGNNSWGDCSVHYDKYVPKYAVTDEIQKVKDKLSK